MKTTQTFKSRSGKKRLFTPIAGAALISDAFADVCSLLDKWHGSVRLLERLGENNIRYFRFISMRWKSSRVDGRRTMEDRRTRARRKRRVHKPAIIRSETRVGSAFPVAIENQQLMSGEDGFGNDGAKPTRPRKLKYRDDHMKE